MVSNTGHNSAEYTYVIGDIQGCYDQLHELYTLILQRSCNARILLAGDLVNRGPKSLETLRFIKSLGERAESVLGNHDLHLLAVAHGIRKAHRSDTLDEILAAPDCDELLEWLRQRPLAINTGHGILMHAGVFPDWTAEQTLSLAYEVSGVLRSSDWLAFLAAMFSNTPDHWSDELTGHARWRCIVNALTRMRFCSTNGVMDFSNKDGLNNTDSSMPPWFDLPERKTQTSTMIFGHWSTLGLVIRPNLISLDTGCVWGGKLSAICLEDRHLIQVDGLQSDLLEKSKQL